VPSSVPTQYIEIHSDGTPHMVYWEKTFMDYRHKTITLFSFSRLELMWKLAPLCSLADHRLLYDVMVIIISYVMCWLATKTVPSI